MSETAMKTPLVDRLRGHYNVGPALPNGEPEFGQRTFPTVPIQLEAADEIDRLRAALAKAEAERDARIADLTARLAAAKNEALIVTEAWCARAERAEAAWGRCAAECRPCRAVEAIEDGRELLDHPDPYVLRHNLKDARAAVDAAGDLRDGGGA